MTKKFLALLLTLLLSLTLSASAFAQGDLLSTILERGELIVATEGTWAPWTYHDESGALVGYDVEVARLIAQKLGVAATFAESEWDGIFAGLDATRYDVALNGVEVTDERAEKYDFTTPYGYIRTALIVRGDNTDISSFEDLSGKRTANSIASTYMTLAESYGAEAVGVDTLDQTIEMVLSGRADATLNAEVSFYDYMNVHPDANLKVVALTQEASLVSVPVRKGETALLDALNAAISELSEEGELTRLSMQYFGSDISKPTDEAQQEEAASVNIQVNGQTFTATLTNNETAQAWLERLPLTVSMSELNGNEKYYYMGDSLPSAAKSVGRIETGDLMLYGSDCLVLFYEGHQTSYSYTPIGRVDDPTGLAAAVGSGSVEVTFSR